MPKKKGKLSKAKMKSKKNMFVDQTGGRYKVDQTGNKVPYRKKKK